ncbi:MAG: hypothetical protein GH143_08635 [Calditrichaeota bacterium]|nr:hypothetical protein [Calditrichota bacterium]
MKKTLLALGLAGAVLIPTQPAQAIIGFGLHVGMDGYTITGETYSHLFFDNEFNPPVFIAGYFTSF